MQIPKRGPCCVMNGEPFESEDIYYSHLMENDDVFERKDYCRVCWNQQQKTGEGYVWKGKIPPKASDGSKPDEKTLNLFRECLENEENPKLLYILSQLMIRKKILYKLRGDHYELSLTGEVFYIKSFILSAEETAQIAEKIKNALDG